MNKVGSEKNSTRWGGVAVESTPTGGVVDDERLRAALRGVLGVVPNSGVVEDGVEFLSLWKIGFRFPRHSTSL